MTIRTCRHGDCKVHCWDDETGRDVVPPIKSYAPELMCIDHFNAACEVDKAAGRESMTREQYLNARQA